ncbi:hypothetical protein RR46_14978 [Papilio xuthus]|uniref:Uncharacterized protein n=1 Tax=Papilio xuthus TaxID=66420 RepID=A0A194PFJ8_PAPXU|nr:hypothetical protein RR46_14978 [Papilio xuthus]
MIHKLKCVISEKGKNMDTVLEETIPDPDLLYKSLNEFRLKVNEALTKLIEDSGDIEVGGEDSNSENEEEVEKAPLNHKRKKKKM